MESTGLEILDYAKELMKEYNLFIACGTIHNHTGEYENYCIFEKIEELYRVLKRNYEDIKAYISGTGELIIEGVSHLETIKYRIKVITDAGEKYIRLRNMKGYIQVCNGRKIVKYYSRVFKIR